MNKSIKRIHLGGQIRIQATVTGDPVREGSQRFAAAQMELLRLLADTPGLTHCGIEPFQTLKMWHNGTAWQVDLEAVVPDPDAR